MITAIHNALASRRSAREDAEDGFTLIELLVVVLIIGILAAIAIPVFLGQQSQAKDAAAKSDLGNAKIAVISYETAHSGTYPTATAQLTSFGFVQSSGDLVTIITASAADICLEAVSAVPDTYYLGTTGGVTTAACT